MCFRHGGRSDGWVHFDRTALFFLPETFVAVADK
jgi:hypothetical protein